MHWIAFIDMDYPIIAFAIIIAIIRFFIPPTRLSLSGSYQAIAHIFVGFLIGKYVVLPDYSRTITRWVIIFLIVIELLVAIGGRILEAKKRPK